MADVKWIKITTDIFDDEKILLIESLPDSYAIIVVWFKLLCLAGKMNNSGVFVMNNQIAYTDKMLATIFRMKESTVTLALQTFEQFGMVEIIDGVITIPNWGKHQNLEQLESKKEYMRTYMKEYREKQRLLSCSSVECKTNSKTNSKTNVNSPDKEEDIDKEIDIDIEVDKEEKRPSIPYETIKNVYNEICVSFPKCTSLSSNRKRSIKARFTSGYTVEDFKTLFTKAEASSFLKGKNSRNWSATFDWLIKDTNMAKVLDGNYDEEKKGRKEMIPAFMQSGPTKDEHDRMKRLLAETAGDNPEIKARAEELKKRLTE